MLRRGRKYDRALLRSWIRRNGVVAVFLLCPGWARSRQ